MDWLSTIAPALSDVPLTILAIVVVGVIVYRVLTSNSRSNDQLYKLFERTITSNDKLSDAITSLERTNREVSDADRVKREAERRDMLDALEAERMVVVDALSETEARIILAIQAVRKHEGD